MQKELETQNFRNTPGFAGPVGRVELLGKNNSVSSATNPTGVFLIPPLNSQD